MSVKIRLRRTGKVNQPSHRIVVTDIRSPRNGTFIECIGYYDPRHKTEKVELDRADFWMARGALPSDTVAAILKRARAGVALGAPKAVAPAEHAKAVAPAEHAKAAAPAEHAKAAAPAEHAKAAAPAETK